MPKRKREELSDEQVEVNAKIVRARKLLGSALKPAALHVLQKLQNPPKSERVPKRHIKQGRAAATADNESLAARSQREAEVLKSIDLPKLADAYLYRTLLKTKSITESELLPDYVVTTPRPVGESEDDKLAFDNVTARMYNRPKVKECMAQIMGEIYTACGLHNSVTKMKQEGHRKDTVRSSSVPIRKKETMATEDTIGSDQEVADTAISKLQRLREENELPWEGFDSGSGGETESSVEMSKYQSRLAASDEESSDEDDLVIPQRFTSTAIRTLDPRDMSVSPDSSNTGSRTPSPQPPPSKREPGKDRKSRTQKPETKSEVPRFIPSLNSGYWSGSESSGTDEERTSAPRERRNRPGQQARRAIAEKKYKEQAKHLKAGKGRADTTGWRKKEERLNKGRDAKGGKDGKDDGWDARRGASGDSRPGRSSRGQVTGGNEVPLGTRATKHRDDVGDLHASWAAAKRAKDERVNAKFEGKKMVFED